MKKLGLLVMPLMAISFLVCCNNGGGGDKPEDVKFSVQETSITPTDHAALIHLDWTPSEHSIEFSNFTFTLANDPITTYVIPGEIGSRPLEITITFSSDLVSNDKGTLKFHYNDKTAKKEGDAKVEDIAVEIKSGAFKSVKKIEGSFSKGYAPEGTTATFEYEYTSPTSFTITDIFHFPDSNTDTALQKHYHNIEVEENGLITDTYIYGLLSASTSENDNADVTYTLFGCETTTYDEEGFITKEQTFTTEEDFEEMTEGKDVIDPVKIEGRFEDAYDETFCAFEETYYLYDENNNLTHELGYCMEPNAQDKFEMQLNFIEEYRYDTNNRLISDYTAYAVDNEHYGIDCTYDENGIISTQNTDILKFKNTTTQEFFANYNPISNSLTDQDFDRNPYARWSYAYGLEVPEDYSKYTLETYSENLEETNADGKYKLKDYYDFEIEEDGTKQKIYYTFDQSEYFYDTVEYRDMSSEIDTINNKIVYFEDKYGNRIKECSYEYIQGEFVIDDYSHTEFNFGETNLLESLICYGGDYGIFESTNVEYCDTEVDYYQNPNWIYHNACQINFV